MRVLQVSSSSKLGGGETHVIELTQKLRERRNHVLVAARPSSPLTADFSLPLLNSADFISALRLRKILLAERISIVHAHLARDYSIVGAAAWRVPSVKVVFTRHLLYPIRWHPLYRRVDGWITPTEEILKTVQSLNPKRAVVIPNWVDTRKFAFCPHPLHSPVCVGLVGQISPHKGHDDALEAILLLGSGFRLVIGGEGDAVYIASLREKAGSLPVMFSGRVVVPDFFKEIDVLAVPSWEEPFGIVILEAMASGIPVVATAKAGPLDIIESEENGMLVPARDPRSFAEAVQQLALNEELRRKITMAGRARVEADYDIDKIVPRIEEFYRSLLPFDDDSLLRNTVL